MRYGLFLSLFTLVCILPAWALTAEQEAKLLASDGAETDRFGLAVALDGDTAVISAHNNDNANGLAAGAAYVFIRTGGGWTEQAKLLAADGGDGDWFGWVVAIDGDTALIGTRVDDDNGPGAGSAYVFIRTGGVWTEQAKLLPADGMEADNFGAAVALEGDTAIIGAPWDDDNGTNSGSTYVFTRVGSAWTEVARLFPADAAAGDSFGADVALDYDTLIIGAHGDDDNGTTSGSAYVFTRTAGAWTEQAKLLAADGAAGDYFAEAVALDGDTAVIGARGVYDSGASSGAAYVFTRTGGVWTEQAKLLPADGENFDRFGSTVALDGDTAVIGAPRTGGAPPPNPGSAYIFTRTGGVWTEQVRLLADDGADYDAFGEGVAIGGDTALIGASSDDDNGTSSGSAYVFRLTGTCGNGILEPGEECDDGNNDDGDGCAADCTIEEDVPASSVVGLAVLLLAVGGTAVYLSRRRDVTSQHSG